jgi:ribonuclease VapC
MVLDTSAVLAVLLDEPERASFSAAIEAAPVRLMSVVTLVEATLVWEGRKGPAGLGRVDRFVADAEAELVPVSPEQAEVARNAFRRFGRGRHPGALNFGDCFAYALARTTGAPLLYKGDDFARTDIVAAA